MRSRMTKRKLTGVLALGLMSAVTFGASSALASSLVRVSEPNLVAYTIVDGVSIPKSLTGKPGNVANGRKIMIHRKKGNCLTCHTAPIPEEQFHGEVAPDLAGVGDRMTEGEIRLRLVDPKVLNPETPMMSYYKTHGLKQVAKKFVGKPMLSAEQIEDVVAYLTSLK